MIKRVLFIVVVFFLFGCSYTRGDTTDHFTLYYNNIKIRSSSGKVHDSIPLEFNKKNIARDDKLTVKYTADSLCGKCKHYLVIIDSAKRYVKVVSNSGQGNPLTFALNEVLEWSNQYLVGTFEIYYYEEKPAYPTYLFTLKLY